MYVVQSKQLEHTITVDSPCSFAVLLRLESNDIFECQTFFFIYSHPYFYLTLINRIVYFTISVHITREKNSYKPQDWILKVSKLLSSDLKVGDDVLWLSGPHAQVSSSRLVAANQQLTLTGKHICCSSCNRCMMWVSGWCS